MALNTEYKGAPWVKTLPAPMRYPEDCRTGILPSGKVTVITIRMTKANGDGNAPGIILHYRDMFTQSFILPYVIPMLKMPVP